VRTIWAAIVFLVLAATVCGAAQPAAKITADNCTPQPDCRFAFTNLNPGAPTGTGIKAQEGSSGQNPDQQAPGPRGSFRIPQSPE
jgi:hypothetical protein